MGTPFRKLHVSQSEAIIAAVVFALIGVLLQSYLINRASQDQREAATRAAGTIASGLRSEIEKFELVTIALSTDRQAQDLLVAPAPARQVELNQRLSSLRDELGASVIYMMDLRGDTVVASNWQQPDSFVGQNYRFRSYFRDALARGERRQFALGTRSRVAGLYLARRINDGARLLGVIVVKIRFDTLERDWRSYPGKVFASDTDGVVLITDDPAQRFRMLTPLSAERRATLRRQLDFGDAPLILDTTFQAASAGRRGPIDAQVSAGSGLTLHVVQDETAARRSAQLAAWGFTTALMTAAGALVLFARSRRRAALLEAQQAASQRIDLLKDELAQANRLAILGQIVAGVSHEIGQPVAAIALQADSGRLLAETGDAAGAGTAFERIAALTRRIAAITGELRRFSRRTRRDPGPSLIGDAVTGACQLLANRIGADTARVEVAATDPQLMVEADNQRCEQILVNLLQNALDATTGRPGSLIRVEIVTAANQAVIDVSDNGPGIAVADRATLFQPFHTGKPTGLGLGLVISRDLARDLGGDLVCLESDAGALFRLTLPIATSRPAA